ncbi:hypothetical protein BH23BAC3_BH23BAC3_24020 [soil metagenome]
MLTENKFSKYLIYGIGEIVLVVIGILIALQLNNLNEESKIDTIRKVYYNQLLQDFEKDKNYIEKWTLELDSNMVKLKTYKESFRQPNIPTFQIIQSARNLSWTFKQIQFQSNTINTLQNTGDIKLLPVHIRNKIIEYNRIQEATTVISSKTNQMGVDNISVATTRYFGSPDLMDRMVNQPQLLEYVFEENRQIQIIIALEAAQDMKERSELLTINSFNKMLVDIDEITKLINNELEE